MTYTRQFCPRTNERNRCSITKNIQCLMFINNLHDLLALVMGCCYRKTPGYQCLCLIQHFLMKSNKINLCSSLSYMIHEFGGYISILFKFNAPINLEKLTFLKNSFTLRCLERGSKPMLTPRDDRRFIGLERDSNLRLLAC